MARTDMGKIRDAIEAGRRADRNIDYGPVMSDDVNAVRDLFADWQFVETDPTIFVMGVHKWGSTYKVTK